MDEETRTPRFCTTGTELSGQRETTSLTDVHHLGYGHGPVLHLRMTDDTLTSMLLASWWW